MPCDCDNLIHHGSSAPKTCVAKCLFPRVYGGFREYVQVLGHDPFTGALYAFTNRQRNKIKCLYWENNGFVLYYKALAEEKFHWPKHTDDDVLALTGQQINWLLDGYDISRLTKHKKLDYSALA